MTRPLAAPRHLATPEGWEVVGTEGFGPFTTRVRYRRPDGTEVVWSSREHRKGVGATSAPRLGHRIRGASRSSLVIGALFMIGSACFALGSFPPYFDHFSYSTVAATFFIGSLFFTSAAYGQFHEAISAPRDPSGSPADGGRRHRRGARWLSWEPTRIDWWASTVQFAGTLFFNVTTFAGLLHGLDSQQEKRLVWGPDVYGSICFLIASELAFGEVCHRFVAFSNRTTGWWISGLNMAGSIAFGVSALAAFVLPTTGEVANIELVNLGTFVGAVCFFVGAALLPVESARGASST